MQARINAFAILAFVCALFTATAASAEVECAGSRMSSAEVAQRLNQTLAGYRQTVMTRTLVIDRVVSVSGAWCQIDARIAVTLERGLRRDGSGYLDLTAAISPAFDWSTGRIWGVTVRDPHVVALALSHTTDLGDWVLRLIADRVIRDAFDGEYFAF